MYELTFDGIGIARNLYDVLLEIHSTEFSRIVQNFAAIASDVHIEVDKTGAGQYVVLMD